MALPYDLLAYQRLEALAQHQRYLGAFIFGSMARGDAGPQSDLDVKVVIDADNDCTNINHPHIDGVKLDITFISLNQLRRQTDAEIERGERVPMLAESIVVFDKTGALSRLKEEAQQARPKAMQSDEHQLAQFLIYHADNKVERHLVDDPLAALLVMHVSFYDILSIHYQIQGRWRLSDKRLLRDLRGWDPALATLVEQFVATCEAQPKYALWSQIIDYVLAPLGGRQPISENNCACPVCRADLALLTDTISSV